MGGDLVELTLVSSRGSEVVKRLPLSLEVGRLRVLLQRLFRTGSAALVLTLRADRAAMPMPLDDDMRSLGFYGATDGAQIIVAEN